MPESAKNSTRRPIGDENGEFSARRHRARRKKSNKFYIGLAIYASVLLAVGIILLGYVKSLLVEFERSQPEYTVKTAVQELHDAAENGSLQSLFERYDSRAASLFGSGSEEYTALLRGDLTFRQKVTATDPSVSAYDVYSGENRVAVVKVQSSNARTRMVVFPVADWSIVSIEPASTKVSFALPMGFTVTADGREVAGVTGSDGDLHYDIDSLYKQQVTITDVFGKSHVYGSGKLSVKTLAFVIPSTYKAEANGSPLPDYCRVSSEEIADFGTVSLYFDGLPTLDTYAVNYLDTGETPVVAITDHEGNSVEYDPSQPLKITSVTAHDTLPGTVKNAPNSLAFAKNWSLFNTNDYKLADILKYFPKGSELEKMAKDWATGVDHTFTAAHRTPTFSGEKVSDFRVYGEKCFSCDVSFTKHMYLTRTGANVTDEFDSTVYWYYSDTDAKWYVADIRGKVNSDKE